jgi:predicted MFS family arabinose efflux permease
VVATPLLGVLSDRIVGDETPPMVRGAMNAVANAGYVLAFSIGAPLALTQTYGFCFATQMVALLLVVTSLIVYRWLRPMVAPQPTTRMQSTVQTPNL